MMGFLNAVKLQRIEMPKSTVQKQHKKQGKRAKRKIALKRYNRSYPDFRPTSLSRSPELRYLRTVIEVILSYGTCFLWLFVIADERTIQTQI